MVEYLRYGAIGLGLALAVLTYLLLKQEQKLDQPRPQMLRASYAFMLLAVLLSAAGFWLESAKSDQAAEQLRHASEAERKLERIQAAMHPLVNARVPTIQSLPDHLPQKQQLLAFQTELQKVLDG